MTEPTPMTPLPGYRPQSQANLDLVTMGKHIEERLLRYAEMVEQHINIKANLGDPRMRAIGVTHIQLGFMALFRSIMNPGRIPVPEDTHPIGAQVAANPPGATPPETPAGSGGHPS